MLTFRVLRLIPVALYYTWYHVIMLVHNMPAKPELVHVMAATQESSAKMAATTQPRHAMAAMQVSPKDLLGGVYRRQALANAELGSPLTSSTLSSPVLPSPVVPEILPLSAALHIMGIVHWCVWAPHTSFPPEAVRKLSVPHVTATEAVHELSAPHVRGYRGCPFPLWTSRPTSAPQSMVSVITLQPRSAIAPWSRSTAAS